MPRLRLCCSPVQYKQTGRYAKPISVLTGCAEHMPRLRLHCLYCLPVQYKQTGRYESHIWDPQGDGPGLGRGRQLHLGSFGSAIRAAR